MENKGTHMNTPNELIEVIDYLNSIQVEANTEHEDGRVNSIQDELMFINALRAKFGDENIIEPKAREWFDVRIFGYPVQFKSSSYSKGASDNFSSKAAILYALTTLNEDEVSVRGWEQFEQSLLMNQGENNRDYYIISMNKDDNSFTLSSLKTLTKLTSNGNNLPFQIKWKDNIKRVNRNYDEAYRFIVGCYKESVTKKLSVHKLFDVL
jgi:hypothetical protein